MCLSACIRGIYGEEIENGCERRFEGHRLVHEPIRNASKLLLIVRLLFSARLFSLTRLSSGYLGWIFRRATPNFRGIFLLSLIGGLEIRWVDETYGCHDKYYWVMKEFPGDIVITADDDVLYPPTFVQQLVATHYKYRDSVISYRTHCIRKSADGYFAPYSNWVFEQLDFLDCPRFDLLPTGVGGVLYPPYWCDDDLFNLKVIQGSLKNADDLWLYIYGRMKGSSVVAVPSIAFPLFYIDDTQKDGLFRINLEQGGNDMALQLFFEEEPCLLERILDPIELEPEVPPDCSDEEGRRLPFLFVKIRRAIHRMH